MMFSFQKRDEAVKLLQGFEEAKVFFHVLNIINSHFPDIDAYLIQIGEGGNSAHTAANQLHNHLITLKKALQNCDIREFYRSLEAFQDKLKAFDELGLDTLEAGRNISSSIDIFSAKYGHYISSYTANSAAPLIIEARKLSSMLDGLRGALSFFSDRALDDEAEAVYENYSRLSLFLASSMSVGTFAKKLTAVHIIYKETCDLLGISASEYPLVIEKIESGSLKIAVIGNDKVIGLLVAFISSIATYVYTNYTTDGKLSAISKKVEQVDAVLSLTSRLEALDVNVIETKENISKAAVKLSQQLNTLIDGEVEVVVNEESYSVGSEVQKKLLESKQPFKLEYAPED